MVDVTLRAIALIRKKPLYRAVILTKLKYFYLQM